jgi:hypothetical protein
VSTGGEALPVGLARFVEANAPPVRLEALAAGTAVDDIIAARVRAEVAEKMLVLLQAQLAEMTASVIAGNSVLIS